MNFSVADLFLRLGVLFILLALSAFFSSAETALFSLSRSRIGRLRSGSSGERLAARLLGDPQRLLSTIIIGNLFVNVFLASLVAATTRLIFDRQGVPVAIFTSTALLLVFGEVTPKTLAVGKATEIARRVALPLTVLTLLFTPFRILLKTAANGVLFLLGQERVGGWPGVTREEVSAVVALGEAQGVATSRERMLLDNILDATTVDARSLMVPRTDIHGIEDKATISEALAVARRCRHSQLPIYHRDLDDSWGIFSAVDVLRLANDELMAKPLVDFREQIKSAPLPVPGVPIFPALLAPETARVDQLLDAMRERRTSAALVVDEYGGTAGMLTIGDILAEIVGSSRTSKNAGDDGLIERQGVVLIDGRTSLRDFNRQMNLDLPIDDADTMGGYVMEKLGRIPRTGDQVASQTWTLEVMKMAGRRVGTLRFEGLPAETGRDIRKEKTTC